MSFFVDVILPFPLRTTFTYQVNREQASFLKMGMRVVVTFGKRKFYTALVTQIHQETPKYETKEIEYILDEKPILTPLQFVFFQWVANYYLSSLGEVLKMALPSAFLLEGETVLEKKTSEVSLSLLNDDEFLVYEALGRMSSLLLKDVGKIIPGRKGVLVVKSLVEKGAIQISEKIYEKYTPKLVKYIRLFNTESSQEKIKEILQKTSEKYAGQKKIILAFYALSAENKKFITASELINKAEVSPSSLSSLVKKEIFQEYYQSVDRVSFATEIQPINELTSFQQNAFSQIQMQFKEKEVVLFQGVFASGKTEIYIKLIQSVLDEGKQVLFLLPEIGITTQLTHRLKYFFGEKMSVYHSKYSVNERVEVWNNLLENSKKTQLIVGVQSALFLPFSNLGLVIVDQEHDISYKQNEISPRFQVRDLAVVLAKNYGAKILLGSATPSLESYQNAQKNKYGWVILNERYASILLPEIQIVDLKEETKRKRLKGHFSQVLFQEITQALQQKKQVILFQNKRGYAPFLQCEKCDTIPQCPNCDVSLTYHQINRQLRCHYCGHSQAVPVVCSACKSPDLKVRGVGTEQIEEELTKFFPQANIDRMDKDSTRGKFSFEKIIRRFEQGETDILVGTQMVSKGLDFENVALVGVLNADPLLHNPDFRALERGFQLLTQVAGRAGRVSQRGKVIIQTYNPHQQIIKQIADFQYNEMVMEQLADREQFQYPPFFKLIQITFKHSDYQKLNEAAQWFATSLENGFQGTEIKVLGPEFPVISRIRNEYIKQILLKIPLSLSPSKVKNYILRVEKSFLSVGNFRSVKINYNVDV